MKAGFVSLVGAGPGDPGLITVKGLECVQSADVIVHDRLVDKRILGHAREQAELIDVGKVRGDGGGRQAEINTLLVRRANQGDYVVRLKGGDPFVFGRGGEEAEALHADGVAFEIVPGVTSAIAVPAYAGIPLTHRGVSSSFTVVTGSESPDKPSSAIDWESLGRADGTLVVLMGWESLASIAGSLVGAGRSPETPVAIVQWGTEPQQQTVVGNLGNIVARSKEEGLSPPVVAIIGDVVELRGRLRWFDDRPLFGKRVLVTRTRAQASSLSAILARRGAHAIELPTIEIRPLDDYAELDGALARVGTYDWVVFTSVNAVQICFDRLRSAGLDARAFGSAKVAAMGTATVDALAKYGIVPDYTPRTYDSGSLAEGLEKIGVGGAKLLVPRSDIAREALTECMRALGASVDDVAAYRTTMPRDSAEHLRQIMADGVDVATFTSSSTVTNLVGLLDGDLAPLSDVTVACIGPVTASTAREMGLKVDIVAEEHTVSGLVDSLERFILSDSGARAGEKPPRKPRGHR